MNFVEIARQTLDIEASQLSACSARIGDEFARAVELIFAIKGKLIVLGVGKSGLVGAKIAATMASTGTPSFFIHPTEALHGDLGMIGKEDGVLAISYSGESPEITQVLAHLKRSGIPLISMCGRADSTLAGLGNVVLDISVSQEACSLGIAPTSSTTLTMALGDALAVALMKKRGFQKEDFASFHPGGSLGKRLFVKVSDLMRTENLPIVALDATLKEAIVKMSEGKLGNVLLCENGSVTAVFSDGDLRRALMKEGFSLDHDVFRYATKSPKMCNDENQLAADALAFIEAHKIQMLVVNDAHGKLRGVVHLHDLVEAGIK